MVFLLYLFAGWYVLVALMLFRTWLKYVERDRAVMTPGEQWLSGLIMFLSTSLWVFTLPLTYMELLRKQSQSVFHVVEETLEELELSAKKQ